MYATFDDVIKRYRPLTTMIGSSDTDVMTVDVESIYIFGAQGIIDAYLGAKYQVPLAPEPIITQIAADIAIYKILEDRASRVPEIALRRYTNATSILAMLRDGQMTLTSTSQTLVSTGDNEAFSTTNSFHPVFSPVLDAIDQYVDTDHVEAEINERRSDYESWR